LEDLVLTAHRRRGLARLAGALATLLVATGTAVATMATPAAAACATSAHVYAKGPRIGAPLLYKFQNDPINGVPAGSISVGVAFPSSATVTLGGNGLKPDEQPFWDVYEIGFDGTILRHAGNVLGRKAAGNCVANEGAWRVPATLLQGTQRYLVKATYQPGNSGGVISQQNHFLLFVGP
jgi:hypothetical protein